MPDWCDRESGEALAPGVHTSQGQAAARADHGRASLRQAVRPEAPLNSELD